VSEPDLFSAETVTSGSMLSTSAFVAMAAKYTVEKHLNEADWKKARLRGIGASEASAVVRLSRFCSPFALYWRKIEGRFESDEQTDQFAEMQDAGHRHERTIADWFLEHYRDHNVSELHDPGDYTIYRSTERPHVFITPDREGAGVLLKGRKPVELKCAWFEAARVWRERVPVAYQVQMQQQLYVTGADAGFFAVLLDGYRFAWYRVERHEKFIARLCARLDEFWERVQRRDPPPVDGSRSSLHALFNAYPKANGQAVDVPDELGAEWDALQQAETQAKRRRDELKARLQQMIGSNTFGRLGDDSGFRWVRNGKGGRFERVEKVRPSNEQ
jgi:putative phage-type endonuclease